MVGLSTTKALPEWCADVPARSVYYGPIRDGKPGSQTAECYHVLECVPHRLGYLSPFPEVNYSDDSYRVAVNESAEIEQYFRLHAAQQPGYLKLIRPYLRSGQVVADVGCGGGALLDLVQAETGSQTIAIEPYVGYHSSLTQRGHTVFGSAADVLAGPGTEFVDVALSFHVIEHTIDPVEYLQEIRSFVRPGGLAVVLTPNLDDFLMHADAERMAPFFYRRVHNYYFTAKSLRWIGGLAGWEPIHDIHYHEFGMSNALLWLRDGKPSGHARLPGIDNFADTFWINYLEQSGQANNVGVVLRNA